MSEQLETLTTRFTWVLLKKLLHLLPGFDIRGTSVGRYGTCKHVTNQIVAVYSSREPTVCPTGLRPVQKIHVNVLDIQCLLAIQECLFDVKTIPG